MLDEVERLSVTIEAIDDRTAQEPLCAAETQRWNSWADLHVCGRQQGACKKTSSPFATSH